MIDKELPEPTTAAIQDDAELTSDARPLDRRAELIEAATDYALDHGLIGLSLRPLAAALGTSDRMLLYHLGSKDELLTEIIRTSTRRSTAELRALAPAENPGAAVRAQWELRSAPCQAKCARLYVEASALGLLGREPYASAVAEVNLDWLDAVRSHLTASGVPLANCGPVAVLVEAAFMGFELDNPIHPGQVEQGLSALERSVDLICATQVVVR